MIEPFGRLVRRAVPGQARYCGVATMTYSSSASLVATRPTSCRLPSRIARSMLSSTRSTTASVRFIWTFKRGNFCINSGSSSTILRLPNVIGAVSGSSPVGLLPRSVVVLILTALIATSLLYIAMQLSPNATIAALMDITYPAFIAVVAWLLYRVNHLDWHVVIGAVLIFSGALVILSKHG